MAEGVSSGKPVKSKPELPPKPTTCSPLPKLTGVALHRTSARPSPNDKFPPSAGTTPEVLNTQHGRKEYKPHSTLQRKFQDNEADCTPYCVSHFKNHSSYEEAYKDGENVPKMPLSTKPQLLPKPHTPSIGRRYQHSLASNKSHDNSLSKKVGQDLDVEKIVAGKWTYSNTAAKSRKSSTLPSRAPFANFEEFSCLNESKECSPIRPPRSPKHKFSETPPVFKYLANMPSPSSVNVARNSVIEKAHATSDLQELKRTNSLTEANTSNMHLLVMKLKVNNDLPIPPPRRRRISSGTPVSPENNLTDFSFPSKNPNVPEYATVNYSLKTNRKNNVEVNIKKEMDKASEENTVKTETVPVLEGTEAVQNIYKKKIDIQGSESCQVILCNDPKEAIGPSSNTDKEQAEHSCSDSTIQTESLSVSTHVISIDKDKPEDACGTSLCKFVQLESPPQNILNCKITTNEHKLPFSSPTCNNSTDELVDAENGSASSNMEWLSVKSSYHSSASDVHSEVLTFDADHSIEIKSCICNEDIFSKAFEINISDIEPVNADVCGTDHGENNIMNLSLSEYNTNNIDIFPSTGNCKKSNGDSKINVINNDDTNLFDKSEQIIRHTKLTSSLPNRYKPNMNTLNRRQSRRKSWGSFKDHWSPSQLRFRAKKPQELPWHDDGEFSSGTLADLDSSDNAVRQSSVEEVSEEREKKIRWWGSFGKGNRKHKQKRQSQFFCKYGDSSHEGYNSENQVNSSESFSSGVAQNSINEMEEKGSDTQPGNCQNFEAETSDNGVSKSELCTSPTPKKTKAFFIAQELMTSEKVFINVLKLLNVDFRVAVQNACKEQQTQIIPEEDLGKIINSLPQLQSLNEDLLRDLENRIENWNSLSKIADVIVRKGPFLKLYTTYIQNFEAQCNHLDDCCQKYPKFAKVVKEFEALPLCQKLSIKHFMLKPVQRIPQYRLLLEDYFRNLDQNSPDFEDTRTALKIVCDVADHANRSIKLGDHLSKLLHLQSQLGNYEIIKPGRIFLKEGELLKLSRKESHPRYFILLNDCLLYTSYYGSGLASGLKVNSELPLGGMKVNIPQAEDYRNEFSIISCTRSFTLMARSLEERQEWVDTLQAAIREFTSRQLSFHNQKINLENNETSEFFKIGKEVPVWIQDGRVTKCQICIAVFTVTFRRHHCRACGKVVCSSCSDYRAPLQYKKFQPDRVCEQCFNFLWKEFEDHSQAKSAIESELPGSYNIDQEYEHIRSQFKKLGQNSGKKIKKYVPQRLLEVTANDTGSQISGWLQRRMKRSWKRLWFVLKDQVLYVYKASEDVAALETIPVLGYEVEPMKEKHFQLYEGIDAKLVFQLNHKGQQPLVFAADSEHLATRWIAEVVEATVLKS